MADDYPVGYGKPPKKTQYKKGRSGNYKGRPKGARNLKTLILGELERQVIVREDGVPRKVTRRRGIAMRVLEKALGGDPKTIMLILEIDREANPEDQGDRHKSLPAEDRRILERYLEQQRPKGNRSRKRKRKPRNDH